jgi:hypothetical protein
MYQCEAATMSGEVDILVLNNAQFLKAVADTITTGNKSANAYTLIAYQNFIPLFEASKQASEERPGLDIPNTIEGHIRAIDALLQERHDSHGYRRLSWFYLAAILYRATKIPEHDKSLRPEIVVIWQALVDASELLHDICNKSDLWSDTEKGWFELITNEDTGRYYTHTALVPEWMRDYVEMFNP